MIPLLLVIGFILTLGAFILLYKTKDDYYKTLSIAPIAWILGVAGL